MRELEFRPKRQMVVQGNPLLRSGYTLTNLEQRLVRLIISQLDDKRETDIPKLHVTKKQLYDALELDATKRRHELLEAALTTLRSRTIRVDDGKGVLITGWFAEAYIEKNNDSVEIQLSKRLKPYLLDLKESFTKYHLSEVLSFRGEYTVRFYEWFLEEQYKKTKSGTWYVSLDVAEIRARLGMMKKGKIIKYERWQDLRRYVISPAVEEISEHSRYIISWEAVKKGRRINSVKFHIVPKKKPSKNTPKPPPKPLPAAENQNQKHHKILESLLKKCGEETQIFFQEKQADLFNELKKNRQKIGGGYDEELLFDVAYKQALDECEDRIRNETT